jgi:hypothetical protein
MTNLAAPAQPLTDGVVTLRLPSVAAGDVGAVLSYIEQEQLDGGWLPEIRSYPPSRRSATGSTRGPPGQAATVRRSWSPSPANRGSSALSVWSTAARASWR